MSATAINRIGKYLPLIETIRSYRKSYLQRDFFAALTVAVVAIPQSMAYAIIAGVNPVYGLYTAIVSTIIGSAFGSSNHLIGGPTNAIALLVASSMKNHMHLTNAYELLFLMTFLVGFLQILFGVLKLGKVINYVSHSVVVGFTAGAGILIALGQLNQLLGISIKNSAQMSTIPKLYYVFGHLSESNLYSIMLGALTIVIILILKKANKNLPGALIGICVSIALVIFLSLEQAGVKLTGNIPSTLPPFQMINFDLNSISQVFSGAIAIAIIGLVEAISISKSISATSRQKIDANQEFIGQGMANAVSSLFQCFAGSGSFTRSAINYYGGAATRIAGILSGVIVAIVLLFFAPYAKYIPMPSLAGVIMVIAYNMVNKNEIKKISLVVKADAIAMWATAIATVLLPELDYAVYTGIMISIALYLKETSQIRIKSLVPLEGSKSELIELDVKGLEGKKDTIILDIEGSLYFGSAYDLDKKLDHFVDKSQLIVINMNKVTTMDITALDVFKIFAHRVIEMGGKVIFSGVRPEIQEMFIKMKIDTLVGSENIVFLNEKNSYEDSKMLAYLDKTIRISQIQQV